jgi:hypothetical protein
MFEIIWINLIRPFIIYIFIPFCNILIKFIIKILIPFCNIIVYILNICILYITSLLFPIIDILTKPIYTHKYFIVFNKIIILLSFYIIYINLFH